MKPLPTLLFRPLLTTRPPAAVTAVQAVEQLMLERCLLRLWTRLHHKQLLTLRLRFLQCCPASSSLIDYFYSAIQEREARREKLMRTNASKHPLSIVNCEPNSTKLLLEFDKNLYVCLEFVLIPFLQKHNVVLYKLQEKRIKDLRREFFFSFSWKELLEKLKRPKLFRTKRNCNLWGEDVK